MAFYPRKKPVQSPRRLDPPRKPNKCSKSRLPLQSVFVQCYVADGQWDGLLCTGEPKAMEMLRQKLYDAVQSMEGQITKYGSSARTLLTNCAKLDDKHRKSGK